MPLHKRIVPMAIAAGLSLGAAAAPATARTFALAVGISQYRQLPRDLWLHYADADAKAFSAHLASPRGGAAGADRMLVLTNQEATAAAIRQAFQTLLKMGPDANDTLYVFIAGHAAVDNAGAWLLAFDADPENLPGTAISLAELRATVEAAAARIGRVIFLADVCRAAASAGGNSTPLVDGIEKQVTIPGQLLGLMAARPTELSFEGPEFGGGHGAFTWSVLQALDGAADRDGDGFVTAGELIDYVTADVPRLTRNKQHPRDFGNMDDAAKLSDLSKPGADRANGPGRLPATAGRAGKALPLRVP